MVTKIRLIFPTFLPTDNEAAYEVWYDLFKRYDIREVMPLVDDHIRTSVYPPVPAEIIPQPVAKGAGDAWQEVLSNIFHYGMMREIEAVEALSPDVRAAVKSVGYSTLCMASPEKAMQMFTKAYKDANDGGTQLANVR